MQQRAAEWQHLSASAVGQPAKVADAGKASRQHVLHEAAQELFRRKRHRAMSAAMGIILPAKPDCGVGDGEQPMVGNGDAVGIACQVVKHMLGAAEGWLR